MKLRKIYESILNEIGDSTQVPPGARFDVGQTNGKIEFTLLNDEYTVEVRTLISDMPFDEKVIKIALGIDFYTGEENSSMTNKGQALKVMSMVVGSIEEYLIRLQKETPRGEYSLKLLYIKFNPKSEDSEIGKETDSGINSRDRLYRYYIEKFAKKHGSSVTFSSIGGVIAQFKPPLTIE